MILTSEEISNLQYVLPVQGNLNTLELVESIFQKSAMTGDKDEYDIRFTAEEFELLYASFYALDKACLIPYQCLSLIKKIKQGDVQNG